MIYTVFIKKYENDLSPFIHVQLLRQLIVKTSNPFILGWPGYIGRSQTTIDSFNKEINPYHPKQLNGFFFKPLNPISIPGLGTNESYMNSVFGGHSIPQPGLLDHSKILIVLDVDLSNHAKVEDAIDNDDYIVKAILVGSSNQSANTYCVSPTPKGEADVLMIEIPNDINGTKNSLSDRDLLREQFGSDLFGKLIENENIVMSREINGANHNLKDIAKKLLGH